MHKLMEYICGELEELERKADKEGKLSMAEIEYADKLAHIKKSLLSAEEMWDDSEYSEASSYRGSYAGRESGQSRRGSSRRGGSSYRGGSSRRGGSSYDGSYEGSYARRRDSMGRYSRDGSTEMVEDLRELMQEAPDQQTRQEFQRLIEKLEQM